ncbi:MAG: hypothetical protein RQ875_06775 [Vicingaceae bacterium]|nr:hypothetical protein [Vicingaceae bacterium]
MKNLAKKIICIIFIFTIILPLSNTLKSQDSTKVTVEYVEDKTHVIVKNDGSEYTGVILEDNGREILINTKSLGKVYIPKHEIKSIKKVDKNKLLEEELYGEEFFSTRYFLTTNGLSQKKGEHYSLLTLFGPEIQFAVADNLTIGGLTSWLGIPIILSLKYSFKVSDNIHFGTGVLGGSLSWVDFSATGVLPYGSLTFGNNANNFTISGGYLSLQNSSDTYQTPLYSFAAMFKVGQRTAFILDSYGFSESTHNFLIIMPGVRIGNNDKAFQFGLTQLYIDNQFAPFPLPTLGWFKRF